MKYLLLIGLISCSFILSANCEDGINHQKMSQDVPASVTEVENIARNFVEQGRTFVHHAVKRMQFLLPAIFFKMGIAFTLLILVTIVAVNNGFIGFMLLVVGLSSVLAKLQEARNHGAAAHVVLPPPGYGHFLDRSDTQPTYSSSSQSNVNYRGKNYEYPQYTDVVYNKYV